MNDKSKIFYSSLGQIFDMLGSAIHTNDLRFFKSKEIDMLIKFVGKHLPDDHISDSSKNHFILLCDVLEIDSDDLEIEGIDATPTAPDVFRIIYMHYNQVRLLPFVYRLMRQTLDDMSADIELSGQDKQWLKLFLENQRIDRPANWVDLL